MEVFDYLKYLSIMKNCVKEAENLIEKAVLYKKYSDNLLNVSYLLNTISSDLESANSLFIDGGYEDGGVGLYQRNISKLALNSSDFSVDFNSLSFDTIKEIDEIKEKYLEVKKQYDNAKNLFYKCEIHLGFVPKFPEFKY